MSNQNQAIQQPSNPANQESTHTLKKGGMQLEENKDGPPAAGGGRQEGGGSAFSQMPNGGGGGTQKKQLDLEFIASQNWYEGRPKDKIPERRAYHISFVHNNKYAEYHVKICRVYIHGGRDLGNGALASLWSANVSSLKKI